MRGCLSKKEKTNMNNLEIFVFSRFRVLLSANITEVFTLDAKTQNYKFYVSDVS